MKERIDLQAVAVDEATDADMCTIVVEEEAQFCQRYPEGSFQRLFWEEQKKAAAKRNVCGVRWHPLMIMFCLYPRHQSGKAYETLRDPASFTKDMKSTAALALIGFANLGEVNNHLLAFEQSLEQDSSSSGCTQPLAKSV